MPGCTQCFANTSTFNQPPHIHNPHLTGEKLRSMGVKKGAMVPQPGEELELDSNRPKHFLTLATSSGLHFCT